MKKKYAKLNHEIFFTKLTKKKKKKKKKKKQKKKTNYTEPLS